MINWLCNLFRGRKRLVFIDIDHVNLDDLLQAKNVIVVRCYGDPRDRVFMP